MTQITISTTKKREVIDITERIKQDIPAGKQGVVHIFILHTTAAITAMDLDPGTDLDFLDALDDLLPDLQWRHPHNPSHTPDHLLASIIGPSLSVPYADGQLLLGTWQRIVLLEFDGARDRRIAVGS